MCGRYVSARSTDEVAATFSAAVPDGLPAPPPRWNVAPTDPVLAVVHDAPAPRLRVLRWGLVPSWAPDTRGASRLVNARVETAARLPSFRSAARRRRCLLPADGWYEWQRQPGSTARRPPTQPFFLRPDDGHLLGLAGLWEWWRDPDARRDDEGGGDGGGGDGGGADDGWLATCTVLTTRAVGVAGDVHDRCPLVLRTRPDDDVLRTWLDPDVRATEALALLRPATEDGVRPVPVSRDVGSVRNDGPRLTQEVPLPDAWPTPA